MGLKHVGANSVTSVTAYVILYSYIQVHNLVQIESIVKLCFPGCKVYNLTGHTVELTDEYLEGSALL